MINLRSTLITNFVINVISFCDQIHVTRIQSRGIGQDPSHVIQSDHIGDLPEAPSKKYSAFNQTPNFICANSGETTFFESLLIFKRCEILETYY